MSTQAKKATKNDVLVVAQRLMLSNGQTSTLEVKMELRKAGFFAIQDDISTTMSELADQEGWKVGDNGHHRLYAGKAIQAVLKDSLAMIAAVNNGSKVNVTPVATTSAPSKTAKTVPATTKNDGTIAKSAAKAGDWEANSVIKGQPTLYFPASIGRDKARSLFAKITGTSRNDARARMVK